MSEEVNQEEVVEEQPMNKIEEANKTAKMLIVSLV